MLLEVMTEELLGVLEADFVEPIHDKKGFERTTVLQRLENAKEILVCFLHLLSSTIYVLCLNYIVYQQLTFSRSTNCQHIVYAKRIKSAPDAKPKSSVVDTSDEDIV